MRYTVKLATIAVFACSLLLLAQTTHAQTLAKNGDWLEKQFRKLITEKDKDDAPTFTFKGCQMNMAVESKDKDGSVGMNMSWQLNDVRKVSYKKEKSGQYTLVLDVPADRVKMAMSLGGFSGSFDTDSMDDKDKSGNKSKESNTTLDLNTEDESLVKQIKQKLEESVQLCRQGRQ